ncbi:hypothetical protein CBL_01063 [Carabus blaptoides fortunei]
MKNILAYHLVVTAVISHVITVRAITNSADILNLNDIQDGVQRDNGGKYKDGIGSESQEKRSLFKLDMDRRGYYPSASAHGNTGFNLGSGINFGGTGHSPNYHTSGNGYSYGAPNVGYPPVLYGGSYPSSGSSGFGHSGHAGGGSFGLLPASPNAGGFNKAMALKGLLIPIAGVALLGAAAVLAKSNPVLLQLGVISGKKKRSILGEAFYPVNPFVRPAYEKI